MRSKYGDHDYSILLTEDPYKEDYYYDACDADTYDSYANGWTRSLPDDYYEPNHSSSLSALAEDSNPPSSAE